MKATREMPPGSVDQDPDFTAAAPVLAERRRALDVVEAQLRTVQKLLADPAADPLEQARARLAEADAGRAVMLARAELDHASRALEAARRQAVARLLPVAMAAYRKKAAAALASTEAAREAHEALRDEWAAWKDAGVLLPIAHWHELVQDPPRDCRLTLWRAELVRVGLL